MNIEETRLAEACVQAVPWKKRGPSSERQWGTVREDYSETGNAWDYFSHDRPGPVRTLGEDGLAGISGRSAAAVLRVGSLERE